MTAGDNRLAVGGAELAVLAQASAMNYTLRIRLIDIPLFGVVHAVAGESARDELRFPVVENGGASCIQTVLPLGLMRVTVQAVRSE